MSRPVYFCRLCFQQSAKKRRMSEFNFRYLRKIITDYIDFRIPDGYNNGEKE